MTIQDRFLVVACDDEVLGDWEAALGAIDVEFRGYDRPSKLVDARSSFETAPDLLLLDHRFQEDEPNGVELARSLRRTWLDSAIIFVTAFSGQLRARDVIEIRANACLEKPIVSDDLSFAVIECLLQRALSPGGKRFESFINHAISNYGGIHSSNIIVQKFSDFAVRPVLASLLGCIADCQIEKEPVARTPIQVDVNSVNVSFPVRFPLTDGQEFSLVLEWRDLSERAAARLDRWMELGLPSLVENTVAAGLSRVDLENRNIDIQMQEVASNVQLLATEIDEALSGISGLVEAYRNGVQDAEMTVLQIDNKSRELQRRYEGISALAGSPKFARCYVPELFSGVVKDSPFQESVRYVGDAFCGQLDNILVSVDYGKIRFVIVTILEIMLTHRSSSSGAVLVEVLGPADEKITIRMETEGEPVDDNIRRALSMGASGARDFDAPRRSADREPRLALVALIVRQHGGDVRFPDPEVVPIARIDLVLPVSEQRLK